MLNGVLREKHTLSEHKKHQQKQTKNYLPKIEEHDNKCETLSKHKMKRNNNKNQEQQQINEIQLKH